MKLFVENSGVSGDRKSNYQMLLEAGYSEGVAKQQSEVLKRIGLKQQAQDIVKQLEQKRQMALNALNKQKTTKSKARDLAYITDILTKNIQLLSGKATGRTQHYVWGKE